MSTPDRVRVFDLHFHDTTAVLAPRSVSAPPGDAAEGGAGGDRDLPQGKPAAQTLTLPAAKRSGCPARAGRDERIAVWERFGAAHAPALHRLVHHGIARFLVEGAGRGTKL